MTDQTKERADDLVRLSPVEVTIFCPVCSLPHIDEGEWASTRHHKTHQCQGCGHEWRPFAFATVGVAHPTPKPARADIGHTADELPKVWAERDAEFEARLEDLTITPDASSLDELARSISGALQDCPAMSIDKQAEFVARAFWPAIQPARAEREEIGKLQAQARTLFLHDAHDGAATAYGPLSHDMLIQMIVERNVILKKLLALRPQPAPVQAVVKDHLTTESPATRTSTHMKGEG